MLSGYRSQSPPSNNRGGEVDSHRTNDRDRRFKTDTRREVIVQDDRPVRRYDDAPSRKPYDDVRRRIEPNEVPAIISEPPARRQRDNDYDSGPAVPVDVKRRRIDEYTPDSAPERRHRSPSPQPLPIRQQPLPMDRSGKVYERVIIDESRKLSYDEFTRF